MSLLELVRPQPDWFGALEVAMTRPPGVPERRAKDDPWRPDLIDRPRRISDDLAWLRQAVDEPKEFGLRELDESAAVAIWEPADDELTARLGRLQARGVLDAAGFLLHEPELTPR
jgi:hypothetical protein